MGTLVHEDPALLCISLIVSLANAAQACFSLYSSAFGKCWTVPDEQTNPLALVRLPQP